MAVRAIDLMRSIIAKWLFDILNTLKQTAMAQGWRIAGVVDVR